VAWRPHAGRAIFLQNVVGWNRTGERMKQDGRSLGLIPLKIVNFHIMLALGERTMHGYAIMQEVYAMTQGSTQLLPGTLYRALKEMLEGGLLEENGGFKDTDTGDGRRRYYRLTDRGREAAEVEVQRLSLLVDLARRKQLARAEPLAASEGNQR